MSVLAAYFMHLSNTLGLTEVQDQAGQLLPLDIAIQRVIDQAVGAHQAGKKILIIGNGGSAGIASHSAIDYSKNGGLRCLALNDGAALTCLGNDYGYEYVFAKQIEFHGQAGDLLFAISSSGKSPNILRAVETARARDISVVTFSGFEPGNPLRQVGDINFYVPSSEYGFVEISHQTLLHAIVDLRMGWKPH